MDLIDKLYQLQSKVQKQVNAIKTEEATKNAFILPFISALGYDVFNPEEVTPELIADHGTKKGEKVDYAILIDNKPLILIECKKVGTELNPSLESQLYRYYHTTEARIGILTDGIKYKFFSDLEEENKMDSKPFYEFDIQNFDENSVEEIKKFSKSSFDLTKVLSTANELKYTKEIKSLLQDQLKDPDEEFIRFFGTRVYSGRLTQSVMDQLKTIVKKALLQFINDKLSERFKSVLESADKENVDEEENKFETIGDGEVKVVTTEAELEGYYIIKAILSEFVDPKRIFNRDTQSYFGILLDDNNRKPICRLHFNSDNNKWIGTFDDAKNETKHQLESLDDIYKLKEQVISSLKNYL